MAAAAALPSSAFQLHRDPHVWFVMDDVDDDKYRGGGFGAVPASGAAIACLPATTAGENDAAAEEECAVCLEGYHVGDALRTMPCEHGFHESCIFDWLRVCPLCRFALPTETEEEESDDAEEDVDDDGHGTRTGDMEEVD